MAGKRTLQRRLLAEGTSFRDIQVALFQDRARALLDDGEYSLQEVANALGYAEINSFGKAFRAWTGVSPSVFAAGSKPTGV